MVGSEITSYVAAPQYAFPLTIAGNSASITIVQPVGTVSGSVNQNGVTLENTRQRVGDFVVGGTLGLIGMPALSLQSYLEYKPGFSLSAVAVAMAPTGDYDRAEILQSRNEPLGISCGLPDELHNWQILCRSRIDDFRTQTNDYVFHNE